MKELEDYNWFPSALRNFQTEFIGFIAVHLKIYESFIRYLKSLSLPVQSMNDLCSGSGQPAISIFRKSKCFRHLILSDKYPHPLKPEKTIFYETGSTDVLTMEFKKEFCYTMFNSFHHFNNKQKEEIIRKIQASGAFAFFVEILQPDPICFLKVIFATTIGNLLIAPFVKPFSINRLLLTYLLPVNIVSISYDGIISVIKSLSVKQYQKLFSGHADTVKIFCIKNRLCPLTVIQINPKQ